MPNPLRELVPILEVLAENIDVLPAAGKAVEDYLHPDPEELEDVLINNEVGEVTAFAEVPEPKLTNLYRPTPPIFRHQKSFYRYFIDGSIHTYFLATGIEGTRSFPIELAQVGAAVVERNYDGNVKVLASNHKVLLLIPKGAQGVSDAVWKQLEKIKTADGLIEIHNVDKKHALNKSEEGEGDLRNKAGAKARHRMHELEIELIKATEGLRNENNWLILDGAVKLDDFVNSPYLIGVAKSFRKDPQFYFGRKHGRNQERHDVTAILAGLPHAHRTVAFSAYGGKVAFWYVRLREQRELDYPLMGVVKVELPRPDKTPVDAELADLISGALVAERNVAPYGRDRRWHCHLYPIFIAEQVIKSRFFSQDVLLGAICWPRR